MPTYHMWQPDETLVGASQTRTYNVFAFPLTFSPHKAENAIYMVAKEDGSGSVAVDYGMTDSMDRTVAVKRDEWIKAGANIVRVLYLTGLVDHHWILEDLRPFHEPQTL